MPPTRRCRSRSENVAVPVASITKLMTALVVLDGRQSLDELLTITREDTQSAAGSRLATGTRLTAASFCTWR